MKALVRILLLAACAVMIAVLASDSLAAPSIYRPQLNRNGSLAIVRGLDEDSIFFTHADGSHRELFTPGEEPTWSPDGKRIAYVDGQDVRRANADGSNNTDVINGSDPSWTPAGDLLVSSLGDIVRVPIPSGAAVNLTNTPTVDESQPAASPDGMWIAYTSNQDVNDPSTPAPQADDNLWIMNTADLIASQDLLWESNSGEYRGFPTWAPDSHRLAFADGGDIWTTPPIANNQTNLTNDESEQGYPAWSPDGKLVAYAEAAADLDPDGSKPSTIWTIDVDSSARKQITKDPSQQDTAPDWQTWPVRNGKIAFAAQTENGPYIGSMTASGKHLDSFFEGFDLNVTDMQYAPNGHQIALLAGDNGTVSVINDVGALDLSWTGPTSTVEVKSFGWFPDPGHMVWQNADGDLLDVRSGLNPVNLTETAGITEFQPAVSPDGKHIAFFSNQLPGSDPPQTGNVNGLWTMDFDGLDRQFLALAPQPQFSIGGHLISWSPDSSQIAYTSSSDVFTIPAEGGSATNQTNDSLLQRDVSWSPEGGLIAFDQGVIGNESSIWTIDPISGVRNQVSPDTPGGDSFGLPTWQALWAPNSDQYFVWGDTRCDGLPDLLDLLDILKEMAGATVKHIPGCPWLGENGLDSTNNSGPWGSTLCLNQVTGGDVIEFFQYMLDIRGHAPPPSEGDTSGDFELDCPPIGSYTEFIPVS